jgi:hypothetical protein
MGILSMKYESAETYSEKHPPRGKPDGDKMEFDSFRYDMAVALYHHGLLFAPYVNDMFMNPGLALGFKGDGFYGLAALDLMILDDDEIGLYHPHLGGQVGFRFSPYAILTYEYFHLTYMDLSGRLYAWESLFARESGASRISLALGREFYVIPGLIYVHANRKVGWTLNLSAGFGGRPFRHSR